MTLISWKGEELLDHSLEVARVARALVESLKLWHGDCIALAGVLHDVGKADEGAQERLEAEKGVAGHEAVSFAVSYRVLEAVGIRGEERFLVLVPILRHHQAMNPVGERLVYARDWYRGRANLEELADVIARGLASIGLSADRGDILEALRSWPRSVGELETTVRRVQEELSDYYADAKLSLRARVLAGALMAADTYAARRRPRRRETLYSREVKRFIESIIGRREHA